MLEVLCCGVVVCVHVVLCWWCLGVNVVGVGVKVVAKIKKIAAGENYSHYGYILIRKQ